MRLIAALICSGIAFGQTGKSSLVALGTEPRPKAEDYDAQAKAGKMEIGAEFMVRSFSRGSAMYVANDYLTVEVAL